MMEPGCGESRDGTLLTRLRPARPEDTDLIAAWRATPASPFDDFGDPGDPGSLGDPPSGAAEALWLLPIAGGGSLVVADGADLPIGSVSWRPVPYGPHAGSQALDIGISLRPPARGQGHGSRAQRMLARYLFATTTANRVQASTDVANIAEQRALDRAGFHREGVLRGAQWRQGAWHDLVSYARLREDG